MSTVETHFGPYGGRYVPETLIAALDELAQAWAEAREDDEFRARLDVLHRDFIGRPTPLYLAARLSEQVTERTRAVLVTHLYGMPADMDGLRAVTARPHHREDPS